MEKFMSKRDGEIMEMAAERKRTPVLGESVSIQLKSRRLAAETARNSSSPASSTCESVNSGCGSASCCSSSRLNEMMLKESSKFADLELENEVIAEFSPASANNSMDSCDRQEKTPASEFRAESDEFEQCKSTTVKAPKDAEIEEFFTGAENNLQKQFILKYNFDIVKDEPIKGHYKWIPVPQNSSPN